MSNTNLQEQQSDPRLKEIVDNFDKLKIGVDDPFQFQCGECGKCCINREDILMSPKDMYNAAKELGLSVIDFFKQYCETYVGPSSRIPIVRLVPRGSIKRCRLLKNRKCSIHKAKPAVCAMYPIGRCIVRDPDNPTAELTSEQIQYIFTHPGCGKGEETHTVREWLETFGIPLEDEFFLKWQQTTAELGDIFRRAENIASEKTMELAWNAAFVALYLGYDTEADFMPQFEQNRKNVTELVRLLPVKKGKKNHGR